MDKLVIKGGNKLYGSVTIGGAKNAVVALLPATLLARDVVVLENVPAIRDVRIMLGIMGQLGAEIKISGMVRFGKGEGLEKREDNFADEIAKMVK